MIQQTFREWLREQELNEMAPMYSPSKSGLKEYIWISSKMASHGPRIKVYETPGGKNFSVTIETNPRVIAGDCFVNGKELKRIFAFVIKHRINLIGYWNSELSTAEMEHNIFHSDEDK